MDKIRKMKIDKLYKHEKHWEIKKNMKIRNEEYDEKWNN